MRILYLIDNFSLGGAQTIVKGLMENGAENMQIYAIALRQKQPTLIIDHPNATAFPSNSKYSFKVLKFLKNFISEKKIEILHCQLPRSIVMGYLLKRAFPDIKYIIHEQGDVFESRAYSMLLRIMRKKADGILTCSEATGEMLTRRSHVELQKIRVLYNFVDLSRFSPDKNSSFQGQKIAFAGRIEKRKGWREFIKAALYFKDQTELSFHIAGTGTEVGSLVRGIRKQKDAHIEYLGFRADMKAFYQDMDLLVIPSHFEPMGMVAVEAMACGLPVLAANVPGLNEIVKHKINGWIYTSLSVSELTGAIEEILDCDPDEINSIVERGIEHAHEYSLQIFSGKLQEYYSSLK
jgi:glycosyltransferase involved in cell wall biosynthesis